MGFIHSDLLNHNFTQVKLLELSIDHLEELEKSHHVNDAIDLKNDMGILLKFAKFINDIVDNFWQYIFKKICYYVKLII